MRSLSLPAAGRDAWFGYGLMIGSAACWGLATAMSKQALAYAPPLTLVVLQLSASVLFMSILLLVRGIRPSFTRHERRAALSGALEPGLAYAFGIAGLGLTSATNASLISATEPILVVVLAFVIFGVRTQRRNILAVVVAVIGVVFASLGGETEVSATGTIRLGDGLIVVATMFAALYVVVTSRLVNTVSPVLLAFLQQIVGWVVAGMIALIAISVEAERPRLSDLGDGAGWIVSSGLVQYAFAFLLYLRALQYLPVSIAAIFLTLIPVFGVGGAALLLGETVSAAQWLGGAMIIGAIVACRTR
jgi:drug/metabolite transporter (DMT)-like permease